LPDKKIADFPEKSGKEKRIPAPLNDKKGGPVQDRAFAGFAGRTKGKVFCGEK
jgi:hypothetical protein